MKITLHVNGMTFESPTTNEVSTEEAKGVIYENIENMDKLEFLCSDGRYVVIGEKALSNAILVFSDE